MSVIYSDTFGSALGANWTQLNNWAAGDMTVTSGTARGRGISQVTGNAIAMYNGTVPQDQYAKFTVSNLTFNDAGYNAFPICRCSGDVNTSGAQMDFYAAVVPQTALSGNARNCKIVKVVNGSMSTLGAEVSLTVTNGDVLELWATGSTTTTLSFRQNGSEVISRTDSSSPLTTGKFGFGLSDTTPYADNFEGGDFVDTDQEGFRFGSDDGTESAHGWLAAQDTNIYAAVGDAFLLRALVDVVTGDPASTAYTLRAQKNGSGGYTAVPVGEASTNMSVVGAGAQSVSTTSGGTLSPAYPAGYTAVADDTCIVIGAGKHNNGSTLTPTDPTDYTQLGTRFQEVGAVDMQLTVWAKKLTASEAAPTLTVPAAYSGTNAGLSAQILIIRGGDTATLEDATEVADGSAAAAQWTHTGITTATNGAMVLSVVMSGDDNALALLAGSEQDFADRMSGANYDTTSGGDHAVGVATKVQSTAGAVTMPTWDQTVVGTDVWAGLAIAIKPAVTTNQLYISTSGNIAAGGEATTARLTAPSGKTTSDFVTGRRWDDENGTDSIDITTLDYTEVEWSLDTQSPAANTDYWELRVYAGTTALTTYTLTPKVTMGTAPAPSMLPPPSSRRIAALSYF